MVAKLSIFGCWQAWELVIGETPQGDFFLMHSGLINFRRRLPAAFANTNSARAVGGSRLAKSGGDQA